MSVIPPKAALNADIFVWPVRAIRRHMRCNKTLPGALHENASSSSCSAAPSGDATGQNFVNAATIEINNLETPTLAVKAFTHLRQIAELTEHEAGSRMIAAVRREGDGQAVGHFVHCHATRDQPGSILALHSSRLGRTFIRSESTSDRFQDVRVRDESLELAVFVMNERHMDRRPLDD